MQNLPPMRELFHKLFGLKIQLCNCTKYKQQDSRCSYWTGWKTLRPREIDFSPRTLTAPTCYPLYPAFKFSHTLFWEDLTLEMTMISMSSLRPQHRAELQFEELCIITAIRVILNFYQPFFLRTIDNTFTVIIIRFSLSPTPKTRKRANLFPLH